MKNLYILFFVIGLSVSSFGQIINEFDPDQTSTDMAEFIEIKHTPYTSLDGYIIVLYNGNNNLSYDTIDLTGETTDSNGLFVKNFPSNGLQNGADAIALYQDAAANFPNGTPPTTTNLIDAVVYGTNDPDDAELLAGLGETVQYNDTSEESLNASADGTFYSAAPTAGATNNTLSSKEFSKFELSAYPNPVTNGFCINKISNFWRQKHSII